MDKAFVTAGMRVRSFQRKAGDELRSARAEPTRKSLFELCRYPSPACILAAELGLSSRVKWKHLKRPSRVQTAWMTRVFRVMISRRLFNYSEHSPSYGLKVVSCLTMGSEIPSAIDMGTASSLRALLLGSSSTGDKRTRREIILDHSVSSTISS